jgi:hypothetical protein
MNGEINMKNSALLALPVLLALFATPAFGGTTSQSIHASATDQYWHSNGERFEIGRVALQYNTYEIVDLDTSMQIVDQGWGGQADDNGVWVSLSIGEQALYTIQVAASNHDWQTATYDLQANPSQYAALNSVLQSVNWSGAPAVSLQFFTTAWSYPGWELHTRNAQFDVLSINAVPEPTTYAMMLAGFGLLGVACRRKGTNRNDTINA